MLGDMSSSLMRCQEVEMDWQLLASSLEEELWKLVLGQNKLLRHQMRALKLRSDQYPIESAQYNTVFLHSVSRMHGDGRSTSSVVIPRL